MSHRRDSRLPSRSFVAVMASLLLVALSLPACAPQGPTPEEQAAEADEQTQADRQSIDSTRADFVADFNAGDIDAVMAYYTDDAVVLSPDAPAAQGQDAIRALFEEQFAAGTPNLSLTSDGVEVHGDVAFDHGTYQVAFTPAAAAEAQPQGPTPEEQAAQAQPTSETGEWVTVLKRGEDGSWRVHWDIWNVDRAAPAQAAETGQ